jgi:hypothetical protein
VSSWEITTSTTWQLCWVCQVVTRHDAGVCMFDPTSPIADKVRRDVEPWRIAHLTERHADQRSLF